MSYRPAVGDEPSPTEVRIPKMSGSGIAQISKSGSEIAQLAKECLVELTGFKPDTVSGMTKDEEGWHVNVDMIELNRIPESADVLATYETVLDATGNLVRYQRTRRYHRGQITDEQ